MPRLALLLALFLAACGAPAIQPAAPTATTLPAAVAPSRGATASTTLVPTTAPTSAVARTPGPTLTGTVPARMPAAATLEAKPPGSQPAATASRPVSPTALTGPPALPPGELLYRRWRVKAFGPTAPHGAFFPARRLTLAFTTDGQYGGDDGCNRLSGRLVTAPPRVLALGEPGHTALACSKPVMELAARYAAALALVADYRLTAGQLHLLDQAGRVLLTLVPDSNEGTTVGAPLAGTTWRLVAIRGTPLPSRQPPGVIVEFHKQHIVVDHCGVVTIYKEGPDRTLEMVESEYIPVGLPCDVVLGPGRRVDLMEPLMEVIAYERTGNRVQLLGLAGEALLTLEQAR